MADIELVIKIPEEDFEKCKKKLQMRLNVIAIAIAKGTPLPKGHGRLIDADKLKEELKEHHDFFVNAYGGFSNLPRNDKSRVDEITSSIATIVNAPTIIEADKEYEAEVITRGNCMMCGKELTEGLFFCKECEDKANSRK